MATPQSNRLKRSHNGILKEDQVRQMLFGDDSDDIPETSDDERLEEEGDEDECEPNESDADSDDDGEANDSDVAGPSNVNNSTPRTWHWVKKDLPPHERPENKLNPRGPALDCRSPLEMFLAHLNDEIIDSMLLETNRHRMQLNRQNVVPVTQDEMRIFIGICLFMTIVHLPFRRMYWSPETKQNLVCDSMTCNRFEQILSIIHLNDNDLMKPRGEAGYDRLFRVRPLIEKLNIQFEACAEKEICVSVDEQIIPFKGRHSLKVYMMKKPKKWGYKVWVMAGTSGYVHKFVFAWDNTATQTEAVGEGLNVGKSGEIVLSLCRDQPLNSYVYYDNYFASPDLLLELKRRKLYGTCTLRQNRSKKCPLLCQKDLKRKGRGACDYRTDDSQSLLICEWFDNKLVLVGSNVHGVEPQAPVTRYDRKAKKHITVMCPALIKEYNQNMGGVDKCDMLLALYRNTLKGRKWYRRIMFHLFDLCVVNSWLLYRTRSEECNIQLANFKIAIARGLILSRRPAELTIEPAPPAPLRQQSQSAKNVCVDARFDRVDHFPKRMDVKNAQRCKMEGCNRKSMFMCRKCHVYLCMTGKDGSDDCFYLFHIAR